MYCNNGSCSGYTCKGPLQVDGKALAVNASTKRAAITRLFLFLLRKDFCGDILVPLSFSLDLGFGIFDHEGRYC